MCAGSLGPGCWILAILATSSQVYGAHGCHLACLVPLLWPLGGPWDDPGTILGRSWDIGGHKEGPCGVHAWILSIFWWFWGPILRAFWAFLDQKRFFFISISRLFFLLVFGSKFGCLGLEKHAFGMEGIAKIIVRRNWISCDSRVEFSWFWVALGPIFMIFVALETGSKIDEFSCDSGVIPDPESRVVWWRCDLFLGTVNSPTGPETWEMRDWPFRGSKIWKSKKFKAVIWFHRKRRSNIEDRKNPSQPGGPSSRGRRI